MVASENWKKLLAKGLPNASSQTSLSIVPDSSSPVKRESKSQHDPTLTEIINMAVAKTACSNHTTNDIYSDNVFDSDHDGYSTENKNLDDDDSDILDLLESGKTIESSKLASSLLTEGETAPSDIMAWFGYLNRKLKFVGKTDQVGKYIALDCEMVGVGPHGRRSALARISIVNFHGHVILDQYIRPNEKVINYRTRFSGITPRLMKDAIPFSKMAKKIKELLHQKIIIGHDLNHDFKLLHHFHSKNNVRDTSKYISFLNPLKPNHAPSLKYLSFKYLGLTIQTGSHDSVEDARVAMLLYRLHKDEWEDHLQKSITITSLSKQLSTPLPTPKPRKVLPLFTSTLPHSSEAPLSSKTSKLDTKAYKFNRRKVKRHKCD